MKTQIEQIQNAKRAYIVQLDKNYTRFAVYLDSGEELLEGQVYSKLENYPAFHSHITEIGTSKTGLIKYELEKINPNITVEFLGGCAPYSC